MFCSLHASVSILKVFCLGFVLNGQTPQPGKKPYRADLATFPFSQACKSNMMCRPAHSPTLTSYVSVPFTFQNHAVFKANTAWVDLPKVKRVMGAAK